MLIVSLWADFFNNFLMVYFTLNLNHYLKKVYFSKYLFLDVFLSLLLSFMGSLIGNFYFVVWVVGILLSSFFSEKNFGIYYERCSIEIACIILVIFINVLSYFILKPFRSLFYNNDLLSIGLDFLMLVLLLILIFIDYKLGFKLEKILELINKLNLSKYFFIFVLTLFAIVEVILVATERIKSTYTALSLILLLFVVFATWTIVYAWLFFKAYVARQQAEQRVREDRQLRTDLASIEQQYSELRKFKHDYQNMLLGLEGFVKNGNNQQLADYYQELLKQQPIKQDLKQMTIANIDYLKNDPIRGLVIQKFLTAQHAGVQLRLELTQEIRLQQVNILTVVRVLGILLDNAIEQAQKEKDQVIGCSFVASTGQVEIVVDNAASNIKNVHQLFEPGYTTKVDHQGVGLTNVRQLIRDDEQLWLDTQLGENHLCITLIITEEG